MEDNNLKKVYLEMPKFTGRNVPLQELAIAMKKEVQFIRIGLQNGKLKFGIAQKKSDSKNYSYYCPDRKVWEEIGYFNSTVDKKSV